MPATRRDVHMRRGAGPEGKLCVLPQEHAKRLHNAKQHQRGARNERHDTQEWVPVHEAPAFPGRTPREGHRALHLDLTGKYAAQFVQEL